MRSVCVSRQQCRIGLVVEPYDAPSRAARAESEPFVREDVKFFLGKTVLNKCLMDM